MLESILVALDGSSSSIAGAGFALRLAGRLHASVEGLGIVNCDWIQRPQPVPIGGLAYKKALDFKLMKSADERVDTVLRAFQSDARRARVTFSTKRMDGDALPSISIESIAHDLVVVGGNSLFDVEGEFDRIPLCVDRIVRRGLRPIVMAPDADSGALNVIRELGVREVTRRRCDRAWRVLSSRRLVVLWKRLLQRFPVPRWNLRARSNALSRSSRAANRSQLCAVISDLTIARRYCIIFNIK